MNASANQQRAILQTIARRAMRERGLLPDFSAEAFAEVRGDEMEHRDAKPRQSS